MIKGKVQWILLALAPLLLAVVCIGIGRYSISVTDTIHVIWAKITGQIHTVNSTDVAVIFSIRLPRIILALFVGAGLAVAGAAFQGLFTNPLAPSKLNISV